MAWVATPASGGDVLIDTDLAPVLRIVSTVIIQVRVDGIDYTWDTYVDHPAATAALAALVGSGGAFERIGTTFPVYTCTPS